MRDPEDTGTRTLTRFDLLPMGAITVFAGIVRFISLANPRTLVFDETYYAKDACFFVHGAANGICGTEVEQTMVHPPLGKWILAIGVKIFGNDSFGWRFGAALAGTITVAILYVLAKRLLRSTLGASIASGLLAIDLLHIVQSRISMLDIFVPLFGLSALLFLTIDRDRGPPERRWRERPWLFACGVALGAAVASKWSGGFYIPLALVLAIAWTSRADGVRRALANQTPVILAALVAVPVLVYVLSYAGRVDGSLFALPWSDGAWIHSIWEQQFSMLDFHANLEAVHPYQSPAWSWLLLKRPVAYFYESTGGVNREIMAIGSPFVWWLSIAGLFYAGLRWLRVRQPGSPEGLILAGFLFMYLPWLIQPTGRSAVFLFYLLPAVPFMCLALAYTATRIGTSPSAKLAVSLFVVGAVAFFVYFGPLAINRPLKQDAWDKRIWFDAGCTKPEGAEGPPPGWCWI